jgi:hypothetical protein
MLRNRLASTIVLLVENLAGPYVLATVRAKFHVAIKPVALVPWHTRAVVRTVCVIADVALPATPMGSCRRMIGCEGSDVVLMQRQSVESPQ